MPIDKNEEYLYSVLNAFYENNLPVVFKGALVTKQIMMEKNYIESFRRTVDIDGSLLYPMRKEWLEADINNALTKIDDSLYCDIVRMPEGNRSSRIFIYSKTDPDFKMKVDFDTKPVNEQKVYTFSDYAFNGVSATSIISDKLVAVSSKTVFRRAKDLYDLFVLSECVDFKYSDIIEDWKNKNFDVGSFEELFNQDEDLHHAYNKLYGIENKPEYEEVICRVRKIAVSFQDWEDEIESLAWSCEDKEILCIDEEEDELEP